MQFLVVAHDWTDEDALHRRLAMRDAHLTLARQNIAAGHLLYGVALLDDQGQMSGSVLVTEFDSREQLDQYLAVEPYLTGQVWQGVEVTPCRVGPTFVGMRPSAGAPGPGESRR